MKNTSTQSWSQAGNGIWAIAPKSASGWKSVASGLAVNNGLATFAAVTEVAASAFTIASAEGPLLRAPLCSFESTKPHRFRAVPHCVASNGIICGSFVTDEMETRPAAWLLKENRTAAKGRCLSRNYNRAAAIGCFNAGTRLVYLVSHINGVALVADGVPDVNPFDPELISGRPEAAASFDGTVLALSHQLSMSPPSAKAVLNGKVLPLGRLILTAVGPGGTIALADPGQPGTSELEYRPKLLKPDGGSLSAVELPSTAFPLKAISRITHLTSSDWFVAWSNENEWAIGSLRDGQLASLAGFLNRLKYPHSGLVDEVCGAYMESSELFLLLKHAGAPHLLRIEEPSRAFKL